MKCWHAGMRAVPENDSVQPSLHAAVAQARILATRVKGVRSVIAFRGRRAGSHIGIRRLTLTVIEESEEMMPRVAAGT
jgi:hypothetical protein